MEVGVIAAVESLIQLKESQYSEKESKLQNALKNKTKRLGSIAYKYLIHQKLIRELENTVQNSDRRIQQLDSELLDLKNSKVESDEKIYKLENEVHELRLAMPRLIELENMNQVYGERILKYKEEMMQLKAELKECRIIAHTAQMEAYHSKKENRALTKSLEEMQIKVAEHSALIEVSNNTFS